jgi:hypothetical protein
VLGAAEGFSGPAQRFELAHRWAGENFHCPLPKYVSRAIREPGTKTATMAADPTLLRGARAMTDRTAELEAAVRAQDALIAEAQRLLADFLRPGGLNRDALTLITELRELLEGPRQREAQRLVREALGEDPGNIA